MKMKDKTIMDATDIPIGDGSFLFVERRDRLLGRSFLCDEKHLANVAGNLQSRGHSFAL